MRSLKAVEPIFAVRLSRIVKDKLSAIASVARGNGWMEAIEDADIGTYRTPQEWGVDGLTWVKLRYWPLLCHLNIFANRYGR